MSGAIGLGLVQPVLDVIAREVGCDVGMYTVTVIAGQSVQIDLYDPYYDAALPAKRLFKAVAQAVEAASALPLVQLGKCANEGGTLSVIFSAKGNGFSMATGWAR